MQTEEDRKTGDLQTRNAGTIRPESSADEVLQAWNKYRHFKNQWTSSEKQFRRQMTEWLAINGPLRVSSTVRIGANPVKKKVCVDRSSAFRAVFDAIQELPKGLRSKAVESVLAAEPFRYGQVRELVGDDVFSTIYDTVTTDTLKIQEIDLQRIKKSKGASNGRHLEETSRVRSERTIGGGVEG